MPKGITSLTGFIKKVEEFNSSRGFDLFFRGHSRLDYELLPSVFRNPGYRKHERDLILRLMAESPGEFERDRYTFDKLVRAQHFGVPTRLLDVTTNPLMALYFACESNMDQRGRVLVFKTPPNSAKFFSSDTVSCISNLSQLTEIERRGMAISLKEAAKKVFGEANIRDGILTKQLSSPEKWPSLVHEFNAAKIVRRLVHFIKEEKPYFENSVDPTDLARIVTVIPKKSNARIAAQAGAFLVWGLNRTFNERNAEQITYEVLDIAADAKTGILNALASVGIDGNTVYPELSSVAEKLRLQYKTD